MAPTEHGPKSSGSSTEVEGLAVVLDAGLFGDASEERFEMLRKNLSGPGDAPIDPGALMHIGDQLADKSLNLKDALKAYRDASDDRRWPIVTLRPNTSQEKLEDRLLTLGFDIVPSLASAYRKVGLIPVRIPPEHAFMEALSKRPDISRIERSWRRVEVPIHSAQNDQILKDVESLVDKDSLDPDLSSQRDPIRIGLIDSGIDARHPILQKKMLDQRAFHRGEERIGDRFGHGTVVAGCIERLCPSAQFYSAKVIGEDGVGNLDDTIRAIGWIRRQMPDLIVCSVQHHAPDQQGTVLAGALEELARMGIVVIVPAHDLDGVVCPPADAEHVITVGTKKSKKLQKLTVMATGTNLRVPRSIQADKTMFPLLQASGWTAFNSPAVSAGVVGGVVALLIRQARAYRKTLSADDVVKALMAGCKSESRPMLDPQKALEAHAKSLAAAPRPKAPPKRTKTPVGGTPPARPGPDMPEDVPTVTFPAHQLATGAHPPITSGVQLPDGDTQVSLPAAKDMWDETSPDDEEAPTVAFDESWTLDKD